MAQFATRKVGGIEHLFMRGKPPSFVNPQFRYIRRIPRALVATVGQTRWEESLGNDIRVARAKAADLNRRYDAICSPAVIAMAKNEGEQVFPQFRDAEGNPLQLSGLLLADSLSDVDDLLVPLDHPAMPDVTELAEQGPDALKDAMLAYAKAVAAYQMQVAFRERMSPLSVAVTPPDTPVADPGFGITLRQALDQWFAKNRDRWSPSLLRQNCLMERRLTEVIPEKTPLGMVDVIMIWAFHDQLAQLPVPSKEHAPLPQHLHHGGTMRKLIAWRAEHPGHPAILPRNVNTLLNSVRSFFAWCITRGLLKGANPATGVRSQIDKAAIEHSGQNSMPYEAAPGFMVELRSHTKFPRRRDAMEFAILCGGRTDEARNATWSEFDPSTRVWTIAGKRMKARSTHMVPLSDRAIAVLGAPGKPDEFIFAEPDGKAMHKDGMLNLLQRTLKHPEWTVHGMRSTFANWLAECTEFDLSLGDMALAHKVGSAVTRAYRRTTLVEKRREIMQAWSDYLAT